MKTIDDESVMDFLDEHGGSLYKSEVTNKWCYSLETEGREGVTHFVRSEGETAFEAIVRHPIFREWIKIWQQEQAEEEPISEFDLEKLGLNFCPQCNMRALDGWICHNCGLKNDADV